MNISGDYGTELLLRYTEERLGRELEERRVANERAAQARQQTGTRLSRFARFFFREEVAAGGPEWVRPSSPATAVAPVASDASVAPMAPNVAAPPNVAAAPNAAAAHDSDAAPNTIPASDAAGTHDDERMLRRELASTRR